MVGMLNYLVNCTRPDLLYSVHQCAQFAANPMLSHEQAIERICRYLLGTKDQGLMLSLDMSRGIECFVDADFAGNWRPEDAEDRTSSLSRTGFVIFFWECPITWIPKLQTENALSTTEAEYIALSHSIRELIPFRNLNLGLQTRLDLLPSNTTISCKVFEITMEHWNWQPNPSLDQGPSTLQPSSIISGIVRRMEQLKCCQLISWNKLLISLPKL